MFYRDQNSSQLSLSEFLVTLVSEKDEHIFVINETTKTLEQLYSIRPEVCPPCILPPLVAKSKCLGRGIGIEQTCRDPSLKIFPASGNIKFRDLIEGGGFECV